MIKELENLRKKIFAKVSFSDKEWEDFSSKWRPKIFHKNDFMIKAGEIEKYFYYVEKGVLRAYHIKDGEEICVGFTYDGDFSGAYDSLLTKKPTQFYIQAIVDSSLYAIHRDELNAMYDQYKSVERWGRLFNEELLLGKGLREVAILSFSAEERYRRLMTQSPHCLQIIPQKYLASYLAMTPETFSRLRKKVKL
ncbi:Crp/Fnr family transcriptional regulator [Fulvivirgaceae bacterium BMA10]|uniref:Crp/Fnr family transcriptional regulator n=1 Tax=Splendidivirga corallicola TaxID=3051826 RepID=A0ABT8KUG9_9BACT|nr:Crp/Fnr family transcriptional regulator [Fulvivirgaceae bacterium BMA10]